MRSQESQPPNSYICLPPRALSAACAPPRLSEFLGVACCPPKSALHCNAAIQTDASDILTEDERLTVASEVFKLIDYNEDGYLCSEEVAALMEAFDHDGDEGDVSKVFELLGAGESRVINLSDFLTVAPDIITSTEKHAFVEVLGFFARVLSRQLGWGGVGGAGLVLVRDPSRGSKDSTSGVQLPLPPPSLLLRPQPPSPLPPPTIPLSTPAPLPRAMSAMSHSQVSVSRGTTVPLSRTNNGLGQANVDNLLLKTQSSAHTCKYQQAHLPSPPPHPIPTHPWDSSLHWDGQPPLGDRDR